MFRGTDKYPKEKYSAALKSTGAAANANTTQDRTAYHMTGNADKLELIFELESDRFLNLNYSEHDFKTEAGAVKGEYTKNFASPYSQLNEKRAQTAFTTHTYSHTTMGYFKDIVDMPALDVLASIVFSDTSELSKKLVIDEQKVRFMGGGAFDSRDPNLFTIQVSMVDKADMAYSWVRLKRQLPG